MGTPVISIVPPRASACWRMLRNPLTRVTSTMPVPSSVTRKAVRSSTPATTLVSRPDGSRSSSCPGRVRAGSFPGGDLADRCPDADRPPRLRAKRQPGELDKDVAAARGPPRGLVRRDLPGRRA
ncbi:MAG: hypothetical protein M0Z42_22665 [Actinomycetota bacterium]|nr:hypothetical protein [Actinomycetota bacterium]